MDLFDLFDSPAEKISRRIVHSFEQDKCPHPKAKQERSITVWPNEDFERLTWTCSLCGKIRGRVS